MLAKRDAAQPHTLERRRTGEGKTAERRREGASGGSEEERSREGEETEKWRGGLEDTWTYTVFRLGGLAGSCQDRPNEAKHQVAICAQTDFFCTLHRANTIMSRNRKARLFGREEGGIFVDDWNPPAVEQAVGQGQTVGNLGPATA